MFYEICYALFHAQYVMVTLLLVHQMQHKKKYVLFHC